MSKVVLLLLVSTFIVIGVVGQYCGYTCTTDADCKIAPCNTCIKGDSGTSTCQCGGNQTYCQMRSSYYTCYDSKVSMCCSQPLSHGTGAVCSMKDVCCDSFSIKVCADPNTQFCCPYGNYAAACKTGQTCCGSQYPLCVTPSTQQCCCSSFACASTDTCDCNANKCVPPSISVV